MENLTEAINTFGQGDRCFITIQNYDHMQLPVQIIPTQVNWMPITLFRGFVDDLEPRIYEQVYSDNTSLSNLRRIPQSRFWVFIELKGLKVHFAAINLTQLSTRSRVWNCYIQIQLLPLKFIDYKQAYFPKLLHFPKISPRIRHVIPSSVPTIHVVIVGTRNSGKETDLMKKILDVAPPLRTLWISHDLLFLIETFEEDAFAATDIQIKSLRIANVCKRSKLQRAARVRWGSRNVQRFGELSGGKWKKYSSVTCDESPNLNPLEWTINGYMYAGILENTNTEKFAKDIVKEFMSCKDFQFTEILDGESINFPSTRVARAYSKVWWSIMGNFSYRVEDSNCKSFEVRKTMRFSLNYIALKILPFSNSLVSGVHMFPVTILEQPLQNLKFVSCGERGIEGLAFSNLLNVFEKQVWVLVIITMATLFFAISLISSGSEALSECSHHLIFLWTALVEQGNILPAKLWNDSRTRWIIGSFILAGIVLSNAYKSTNVYNMVLNRRIIPFQKFHELVNASFKIHVSLAALTVSNLLFQSRIRDLYCQPVRIENHIFYQNCTVHFNSESIRGTSSVLKQIQALREWNQSTIAEMLMAETLLAKTSLGGYVNDVVMNLTQTDNSFIPTFERNYGRLLRYLMDVERNGSLKFLELCDKSAIIAPEYRCIQHAQFLHGRGFQHASIGKETYFGTKLGFIVEGIVPHYIIQRIRATETAALFTRWIELLKGNVRQRFQESVRPPLNPPTMSGNVVIIFVVLAGGLIVALIVILIEYVYK